MLRVEHCRLLGAAAAGGGHRHPDAGVHRAAGLRGRDVAGLQPVAGRGIREPVPIAFTAGVAGPIIGADLLHLKDLPDTPVGVMSIGGAGTFDGIVLSGVLAALLA